MGLPRAGSFSRLLARAARTWLLEGGDSGAQERIHSLRVAKYCCHVWIKDDHHGILGDLSRESIRARFGIVESILGREVTRSVAISRTASLLHSLGAHVALHAGR